MAHASFLTWQVRRTIMFQSWWKRVTETLHRQPLRRRTPTGRLTVERLERRDLPASVYYLQLPGVDGPSVAPGYEQQLVVTSFQFATSRAPGASGPTLGDLQVVLPL